ncbi:MAG TPA: sodium:solute symporter [Bacteroidia bacterium]|nr:sodium:solute symporter [Bacteroidia bacterium]
MTAGLILTCVAVYTILLFGVTWLTSRGANNETYFVGNRSSKWYLVAYGMIGASLSGVTFMSVPGDVGAKHFWYFQMVLGYVLGYVVIAFVLLPLYYRLNLTSIYSYLQKRFGEASYKTGAIFFIISRVIGAAFRMFIVVNVLQVFVFGPWGIPFWVTTSVFIVLILLYTYEGGVKTIVWTDTLQTTFMLVSLVLSVVLISRALHLDTGRLFSFISSHAKSDIFNGNWTDGQFFPKAFFGGMFITITMTGLDQEMMQKNISCRSLKDAQKNMLTFSGILVVVNLLFLSLGVLLLEYVSRNGITGVQRSDDLFPTIALNYLGPASALFFIIGLISAAYPSADGALTALTASFCIDILGFNNPEKSVDEKKKKMIRHIVHICFAVVLLLVIVVFRIINDDSVLRTLFAVASYTYGPLLGLFAFGILTKRKTNESLVPAVALLSPVVCWLLSTYGTKIFGGYRFGNELLVINGLITFAGLYFISTPGKISVHEEAK